MVVRQRRPFCTILISLTAIAFVYLTIINTTIDQDLNKSKNSDRNIKKIVAYSLLKQIEIESENYTCDGQLNSTEINHGVIKAGVEADNENDTIVGWDDEDGAWTKIGDSQLYVFSVHLDTRLDPYHYVRIIGMIRGNLHENFYCQIVSPDNTLHALKVTMTPIWLDTWDQNDTSMYFNPTLLSCRIPSGLRPNSVSVTTKACDRERGKPFLIKRDTEKRLFFTVCVKPLNFLDDISKRLIQWIEINRLLGAEKIEIYVKKVHKNVWRILKWYSSTYRGQIIVRTFKVIADKTAYGANYNFSRNLWQKRRYEVVTYNSCFNRNIESSRFIIPLDIDEVILPKRSSTWKQTFENIFLSSPEMKGNFASFMVPNAYFFVNLPSKSVGAVNFLTNIMRSDFSPPGESGKSFISTKNTLTVFNHYALEVLRPGVSRTFFLPPDLMQLNHYKETCKSVILPECVKYFSSPRIKDTTIFKYERVFIDKYLKRIKLFKKIGFVL